MATMELLKALGGRLDEATLNRLISGFLSAPHISAWIKGLDRRYLYVSPGWEEHAGIPRERAVGHMDEEFRPPAVAARFRSVDDRIVSEGSTETREDQVATSDGVRSFVTTKFPLRDGDGSIIAIAGISAETTDFRSLRMATRVNRDLLSSVIESTPDCIIRFTPDFTITFANPAFLALFAAAGADVTGQRIADVLGDEVANLFAVATARLTPVQPQSGFQKQSADRFGRPRWRSWRQRGVFTDDGQLIEIQATGRDVTEERQYQNALERVIATARDTDAPLTDLLAEVLAVGLDYLELDVAMIARVAADGRFLFRHVQRRNRTIVESGPAEGETDLLASSILEQRDGLAVEDVAFSAFANHRTHLNFGVNAFMGQRIEVAGEVYGVVAFYGFKPRLRAFRTNERMFLSILSQWLAFAMERDDRIRALSNSRAELAMILESVPAHIAYKDSAGRVLTANAAARRASAPDDAAGLDRRALHERQPLLGRVERWEHPDPEDGGLWVRTDRIPFDDPASGEPRLLVVATDVSQLVEKEQALAKANEGLNQFAYIASHDLQEPLRKIGTFTDLLVEGLETGNRDDVDYAVRVIKDSARRASALISDLLAWSRLTNKVLDRAPVDLSRFVRDIVGDLLAARPDETVEIVDRMEPATVSADPTQLRQLLENLLTNALKYRCPERPPRIELQLGPSTDGETLRLAVSDNGIGFDPAYRQVIFEPFRRLHSDRRYSGTGVGLAICRRVCDRHGWTVTADGRPGEGATFVISIPRRFVA